MYIATIHNGGVSIPIHDGKEKLTSGKIVKGINTIDSFQFTMLPSNAGFNEIHDYTTLVTVYNTNRNRYEFYGRVLYSEDTMSESGALKKEVICESYLGFLCDSQQDYVEERNWTVGGLLQWIVNKHNSLVESYKQFTIGEVTVTDPNDNVYCGIQRENTWETLTTKLIEKLGGEFRFRVEGDILYLDYLEEIGEKSSTEITLSRNMKSISREKDPSEIVTRLIPLGCKLTVVEDGEERESEQRLTISPVNNGKKYIDDETAIAIYGIRVATVEFDDITVASTLLKRGEEWLIANNKVATSYTITALDLSLIGLDADDFEVCNYYVVKNPLLGINDSIRVIKKNIDICDDVKSTLEFGDNFETLSASMKRHSDTLGLITSNYVTNQRFATTINKTTTLIEQTEERIQIQVDADYSDFLNTTAAIRLDIEGIDLRVKTTEGSVDALGRRVESAESSITLLPNQILSSVSATYATQESLGEYAKSSDLDDYAKTDDIADYEERLLSAESTINQLPEQILLSISGEYATKEEIEEVSGELSLKIGRDENDQIVSMLNASAEVITINSNRLSIDSDKFKLTADGDVSIKSGSINLEIIEKLGLDYENRYIKTTTNIDEDGFWFQRYERTGYAEGDSGEPREVHNVSISAFGELSYFFEVAHTYGSNNLEAKLGINYHKEVAKDLIFGALAPTFDIVSDKIQIGNRSSDAVGAIHGRWFCQPMIPEGRITVEDGDTGDFIETEITRDDSRIITLWDLYMLGIITESKYNQLADMSSNVLIF